MAELFTHYQGVHLSDQESIDNFVVRKDQLNKVLSDLKTTDQDSSFQHYVFVGRRGSGKSTLLRRIQAEINTNEKLQKRYLVVRLSEEQSGVYKIYDLWDYVTRDLRVQNFVLKEVDFRDFRKDLKSYTKKLHFQIIELLRREKKKLILLVDNIDRILKNIGTDNDLFRELLMNFLDIRIIGGSTYMSEQFWKYDKPFYDFFTIKKLAPLTTDEIRDLLEHWSSQKKASDIKKVLAKNPGKIESIRMLTDGTPRTMLIFVDMLLNRPGKYGYDYLKEIVDKATPIYQERLGTLSPAQQKVLTEISFFWEAVSVKDLVPRCNMESKTISSLLNQLGGLGYIEKIKLENKNLVYRVEERFFNLWLIMTQGGPQQKMEARYLTDFLENWYDGAELTRVCREFITTLQQEHHPKDYVQSMSHALLNSQSLRVEERQELYRAIKETSTEGIRANSFFDTVNQEITTAFDNQDYDRAIVLLKDFDIDEKRKLFGLGLAYDLLKNFEKAEKYYHKAIDQGHVKALYNLANLYSGQERYEEAEKYYRMAIDQGDVNALNNLAILYKSQERYEEAEKYYRMAIDQGHVNALYNLALLYGNQERYEEAEKYYHKAIDQGDVNALSNLANLYYRQRLDNKLNTFIDRLHIKDGISQELLSIIYLYLGKIPAFENTIKKVIPRLEDSPFGFFFLEHLLIHKQYALCLQLFDEKEVLRELYKPLHYACQLINDPENGTIKKRIPPEIEEVVSDIISEVRSKQDFYYDVIP